MTSTDSTLARFDERKIDEIFAKVNQCHAPGAAVGIAIGGVPVYRKGFGLANIELPALVTPAMRMRIGSTTKHFASLAFLLLCEEGKASIDDPVEKHITELHPAAHGATMRQLMGHVSGLRDTVSILQLAIGLTGHVTDAQMTAYYRTIGDVDAPPGSCWSYNNGGYMLLSTAIERLTGEPLEAVLKNRIFAPLGMNDTMLRRWDSDFVPNSATLHTHIGEPGFTRMYMGTELTGAGGIVSTADEMLAWLKHMDRPVVGSAETWRLMLEPQRLSNGTSTNYGLGLFRSPYRGVATIQHAGGVAGGNCQMIKIPSADLDIVVIVNRNDVSARDFADTVVDLLVDDLEPRTAPSEPAPARSGLYVSPVTGRVAALTVKDDKQYFSYDGQTAVAAELDEDGTLQLPQASRFMQIRFLPDDDGGCFTEFGTEDRMDNLHPDPDARLGERTGHYRAGAFETDAALIEDESGRQLVLTWGHGQPLQYALEPLTNRIWRISTPFGVTAILTFDDDGQGFEITLTRARKLRFKRG